MCAFLEGFNDLIPLETLQLFDANELELLMCGLQDINVQDWKTHTLYKGEYHVNHPVIVNFWKVGPSSSTPTSPPRTINKINALYL